MRHVVDLAVRGGLLLALLSCGYAAEEQKESPIGPYASGSLFTRAQGFMLSERIQEYGPDVLGREWDLAGPERGGFTFFGGVEDIGPAEGGGLRFTLTHDRAVLGWGHYDGRQPESQRVALWPELHLKLQVRQSGSERSRWTCRFWSDGRTIASKWRAGRVLTPRQALEGSEWQELSWSQVSGLQRLHPDGFGLVIEAARGTAVELRDLTFWRDFREAYVRKTFSLPEGRVWRAVVNVSGMARLYVNGEEVPSRGAVGVRPGIMYAQEAVDIARYLVPGARNCIGLYAGRRRYSPYLWLQGAVVMRSGERILMDTDDSWQWTRGAEPGWSESTFEADDWGTLPAKAIRAVSGWYWCDLYIDRLARPFHDGYLVFSNPRDDLLVYPSNKPVTVEARVPPGLKEKEPIVTWALARHRNGERAQIAQGEGHGPAEHDNSLVFDMDVGRLEPGVYVLHARFEGADGELLDDHMPEPLVVVGRVPMKPVGGADYEEGMELSLEHVIDLTRPEDTAYPWLETPGGRKAKVIAEPKNEEQKQILEAQCIRDPQVVERDGLTYRETQAYSGAQISYFVKAFKHPGDFYLMVLEYPNDAARKMTVACTPRAHGKTPNAAKCSPEVHTGYRYPLSRAMEELIWLYRPDAGPHAVNLINLSDEVPAAGARLKMYHIEGNLPALEVPAAPARWLGGITERTLWRSNWHEMFRCVKQWPPAGDRFETWQGRVMHDPGSRPDVHLCNALEHSLDACHHFAEYLRFAGQNLFVMGCYQYVNTNSGVYRAPSYADDPRLSLDLHALLARVLAENGIDFMAGVEYGYTRNLAALRLGDSEKVSGEAFKMVLKDGSRMLMEAGGIGWNFLDPAVRGHMLRVAGDLTEKFKALPNFLGLNWSSYFGGGWLPTYRCREMESPLDAGYGRHTIEAFERETGIDVPVAEDDPQRFEKRYRWLTSESMRAKWIDWRAGALAACYEELGDVVSAGRPEAWCLANLYFYDEHGNEQRESGEPLERFLELWGWRPRLFHESDNLWLARTVPGCLNLRRSINRYGLGWHMNVSPEYYDVFDTESRRAVHIKHVWYEVEGHSQTLPVREGWPRPFQPTPGPQANGEYTREPFTLALIGGDPRLFMFGFSDVNLFTGNEQPLREFSRVLQRLPAERFEPAAGTDFDTAMALRTLRHCGELYLYAANPGIWPLRGTVSLEGAPRIVDLVTGERVAREAIFGTKTRLKIDLPPCGVAAYKVSSVDAEIVAWTADEPEDEHIAHLRKMADRAAELLTLKSATVVLTQADLDYMRESVKLLGRYMRESQYIRAWRTVTDTRFWTLLHGDMQAGARYGTREDRVSVTRDPKDVKAVRVERAPKIDGVARDDVWQQAEVQTGFITSLGVGGPSMVETEFRVLCDDRHLYILVLCVDRHPGDIRTKAQTERELFRDDAVGILLRPDRERALYYQLAFNPGGLQFDQRVEGGAKDYDFDPEWTVETAIVENGWIGEVRIPVSEVGGSAEPGSVWGFNLGRKFRTLDVLPSSWSYVPGSWHAVDSWGTLRF